MTVEGGKVGALRAEIHGHPPLVAKNTMVYDMTHADEV